MAADALHEAIEEVDHGEDEGSIHGFDIAFAAVEIDSLAGGKGEITEGLDEAADHYGQVEDVHSHGPDQGHYHFIQHYDKVLTTLVVEDLERVQEKDYVDDPHVHA